MLHNSRADVTLQPAHFAAARVSKVKEILHYKSKLGMLHEHLQVQRSSPSQA
jgi:hypothetical protein